ncbi:LptF/LptG family permease [Phenylobacterium sp.]|uniref:LptF/LptG family permease n=1 Tax=Phenylobacterium sp. TaxID=1871053 RepID=UPI0039C8E1AE
MTFWPMVGCLAVTVVSLLLERALRLLDLLSQSSERFGPVAELTANLLPHYLGLALPIAFFVALFIVITKLDDGSEVEALLANGVSLSRLAAPYVALGLALMAISLVVFGYMQPYSRYAYRAVLHAAINAGWDARLHGGAFITDGDTVMTADSASLEGRRLQRLFIRRPVNGGEEVITASSAQLVLQPDGKHVTLLLKDGVRVGESRNGSFDTLRFDSFTMQTSLSSAAALMRARGGDERELTFNELAREAANPAPMIPRGKLLSELYIRLARSAVLPFLPLIAFPLGLAAKRGRRAAGLILAGVLMLAFQYGLEFGEGMAGAGKAPPGLAVGTPFFLFTGFCVWMFLGSRKRPGQTPISEFVGRLGDAIERVRGLLGGLSRATA